MLLVLDVGNTQTVIGLWDGDELLDHWRISTNPERTGDEHALLLEHFLDQRGLSFTEDVTGVAISSVVPRLTATLRRMSQRYLRVAPVIVGPGVRSGMPVLYDNPKEVGADRIANAVGAFDRYGGPTIVVDFGTATTFDAISAKGEYLGGAIVPGIEVSMDALFSHAAGLRRAELIEPRNVIGRSTVESIQSGAIYGFTEMVDGLCRRFEEELGPSTVVSTGGLGGLIAPLSAKITTHDPWLTLHGLRLVYALNAPAPEMP
ncbi:MAG: type III pantothenate kinase [Acidimicrobiales bacterium]